MASRAQPFQNAVLLSVGPESVKLIWHKSGVFRGMCAHFATVIPRALDSCATHCNRGVQFAKEPAMKWNKVSHSGVLATAFLLTLGVAAAAQGADKRQPPPKVLSDLLDCRQITDAAARLACYDTQVAVLAGAAERSDIVVADRQQVEQARRGVFGYAVGSSPLLDATGGGPEAKRLDTTVTSARRSRGGGWIITMAEGGTWEQIDSKPLALSPKPGQKVAITKGSLGSYFVSVDGQSAMKMRRIQ
jgi:hypothetical protein